MSKTEIPRLCGGTFLTQLLLSRKPTVTKRQRTKGETDVFHNEDVLFALLKIVYPESIKPTGTSFETYTTNFKKCDGSIGEDLKFENVNVISAFQNRLKDDYPAVLNEMADFCEAYIDLRDAPKNHIALTKRLIELIRDDVIADTQQFVVEKCRAAMQKSELPTVTKVHLPSFLLSILSFIIAERNDNNIGKGTIAAWHSVPNVKGRYNGIDGSSIEQDIEITYDKVESHKASKQDDPQATPADCECAKEFHIDVEDISPTYQQNNYNQTINVDGDNNTVNGFVFNLNKGG